MGSNPCHVIKAKIGKFSIHHGRFHCLKNGGLANDEVHICIYNIIILFIMEHAHAYIAICTYNYMELYLCYSHAFSFYIVQIMNSYLKLLAYSNKNTYVCHYFTNYGLYSQSSCSQSAISFTIKGRCFCSILSVATEVVAIVIYITVLCMTTTCEIIYIHRKILAEMV